MSGLKYALGLDQIKGSGNNRLRGVGKQTRSLAAGLGKILGNIWGFRGDGRLRGGRQRPRRHRVKGCRVRRRKRARYW